LPSERRRAGGRRPRAGAADSLPITQGWTLAFHPCLLDQVERLVVAAEDEVKRSGRSGANPPGPNQKLLAHVLDLMFEAIPRDPNAPEYRLGHTLGREHAHWRRGKTGGGRYRVFFRFHSDARVIVFAWINDEQSLRTYGSATDACSVFAKRLARGMPPNDWDTLVAQALTDAARGRAARLRRDRPE
jgi:toxin YhaV